MADTWPQYKSEIGRMRDAADDDDDDVSFISLQKNRMFLQLLTDGTGDEGVTEDSADVKRKVKGCCFVY